jgi:glucuronate isomerase
MPGRVDAAHTGIETQHYLTQGDQVPTTIRCLFDLYHLCLVLPIVALRIRPVHSGTLGVRLARSRAEEYIKGARVTSAARRSEWGLPVHQDAMPASLFDPDFMLETETARHLYHEHAAPQPIIDYHNHLPPEQIADNHRFSTLTELWLANDHYKWRAMRANGVSEHYCTGQASDWDKFEAWARTVPYTLRNPLFHWTHLELNFPFRIRKWLNATTAREIYDEARGLLSTEAFTSQGLLRQFRVVVVCTTDDPVDDLASHRAYSTSPGSAITRMIPTWRPDKALHVESPGEFNEWVDRLGRLTNMDISTFDRLLVALDQRHAYFHENGCRSSDHGLESPCSEPYSLSEVRRAFDTLRTGQSISDAEALKYKSALMYEFGLMNHGRGWVQQLHFGSLRNNSSRMLESVGFDTGYDSIGDFEMARPLGRYLDRLDRTHQLTKTILYNLNPRDNEVMASMVGNFQDGSTPGKLQYGAAWWFLDQLDGMEKQINTLSNVGLLSRFVGMLTDSRSFLSFSRHEYFRRLLCNMLGHDVRRGLIPDDNAWLGKVVEDICFNNARDYFGFELPKH